MTESILVCGHERARASLEYSLPQITLLKGPESIGKATLARYLASYYGLRTTDILESKDLSLKTVSAIKEFAATAAFGKFRLVIIDLKEAESPAVVNSLASLMDNSPESTKFILLSSRYVPFSVESRADTFNLGLLTTENIIEVLTKKLRMPLVRAERVSKYARGTINGAYEAILIEPTKAKVLSVLKSLYECDRELLNSAIRGNNANNEPQWGDKEHELLKKWAIEALSHQWLIFSDEETFNISKDRALVMNLLANLSGISNAKPKLALIAALGPLIDRN